MQMLHAAMHLLLTGLCPCIALPLNGDASAGGVHDFIDAMTASSYYSPHYLSRYIDVLHGVAHTELLHGQLHKAACQPQTVQWTTNHANPVAAIIVGCKGEE